jgi:hypothetical protein
LPFSDKTETQAVSGCWRSLTHRHARESNASDSDSSVFAQHLTSTLASMYILSGFKAGRNEIFEQLEVKYRNRLQTIAELALDLNRVIGEEVTSAELSPIAVAHAAVYDPSCMEDALSLDDAPIPGQLVLCTSYLGLSRCEKKADSTGHTFSVTTLLKPKVVLCSLLDSLEGHRMEVS